MIMLNDSEIRDGVDNFKNEAKIKEKERRSLVGKN